MDWSPLSGVISSAITALSDTEVTFTRLTQSWADDADSNASYTTKAIVDYEIKEGSAVSRRATVSIPLIAGFEPTENDQLSFNDQTWKIIGIKPMGTGQPVGYELKVTR